MKIRHRLPWGRLRRSVGLIPWAVAGGGPFASCVLYGRAVFLDWKFGGDQSQADADMKFESASIAPVKKASRKFPARHF
jgi:hypothetical protein